MPTASEYEQAAVQLRRLANQFEFQAGLTSGWPLAEVATGPALEPVADLLAIAADQLVMAAGALRSSASTCDQRAEICTEYHRRVQRWLALAPFERLGVAFPAQPAAWVAA